MSLTCQCDVERNGFQDKEIKAKDKNKVLQVYRLQGEKDGQQINEIKVMIKYQKTMDLAIEFGMKEIKGIYQQNLQKGMLQFQLLIENKPAKPAATNLGRNIAISNSFGLPQQVKVFLNNMEVSLAEGLVKILKEEFERIQNQLKGINQNSTSNNEETKKEVQGNQAMLESKKRKLDQISNPQQINNNPRNKVMKISENVAKQNKQNCAIIQKPKPTIVLRDLPWDMLRIILNFTQELDLKILRFVDKQFFRLILSRKTKLVFKRRDIPEKIFYNLMTKSPRIKSLTFGQNFSNISHTSLTNNAITTPTMIALSKCKNLKDLTLGDVTEPYSQKILGAGIYNLERLSVVKKLFGSKQFQLEKLTLYQCDQYILDALSLKEEKLTLVKLHIAQFIQRNTEKLEELDSLKKFRNINWLNLCGAYYPLQFQIQLPDEQNNQLLSVAGCRELELIFFSMKNTLRYLTLGKYAYDELLNFISEMCKSLEMLEINSDIVTDSGLVPILRKMTALKTLDIAACPLITGICFFEVEEFGITNLQRLISSNQGYEQQKIKDKLKEVAPNCFQQVREQAQSFCNGFIQSNAANLIDFFSLLAQTDNQAMRFWLLQAIVEIVNNYYGQVIVTAEQHQMLHQVYFSLLKEKPEIIFALKHCQNKYALIFVSLLREDFPQMWPEAFQELLSLVKLTSEVNLQKLYMSFIVKCMLVFEEELVERSEKKSNVLLEQQNRVKDAIRNSSITDIIFMLSQVLQNYTIFDEELVNNTLEVMAQLIDWNALELFGEQINIFKAFLQMKKFRNNALSCIHAIAYKGMDYPLKVELLVNLGFLDILESFKIKYRERPSEESDEQEEQDQEEEFFETVGEAVDKLGQWCLEIYPNEVALDLLDTDKPKIGRNIVNFINFWLQSVKKYHDQPTSNVPDVFNQIFQKLLEVVIGRVKYPDWCTYEEGNVLSEHEEDYHVYREEIVVLFINLAHVKPFHDQFIRTLAQLFESIVPGKTPFNQAEVPLFLAYHLQQAIPQNMKEQVGNVFSDLMQYIIKIDFFQYDHKIVSLMLLEDLVRYLPYFIKDQGFQNQIATIFFSKKAIMSNEPQLASRSCYLILRLVERAQNELVAQAPQIIESTVQVITKVETGQHQDHLISYDDLQYLYNVIGIFVSNKKIDYEYRRTTEISQMMKESFGRVLEVVLNILPSNINNQVISDLILSYLQRNVNLLGSDVKPYFLLIAKSYIESTEFERLDLFLTIVNYSITTLKSHGIELIDNIFLALFQKMSSVKIPESDLSDIDKNNNKVFAGFFRIILTSVEIDSTFLFSQVNAPYFNNFLSYAILHLETNIEKTTKKTVLTILKELFIDFSGLTQQQLAQFGRKSQQHSQEQQMKDKSIVNTYPELYQQFVEQLLWISVKYIFQLNPQQLEDYNMIKILSDIQALFYVAGFGEQLSKALQSTINNQEVSQVVMQMCDGLAQKQMNNRQLHDAYQKLLIQIRGNQKSNPVFIQNVQNVQNFVQ
eukprot:403337586